MFNFAFSISPGLLGRRAATASHLPGKCRSGLWFHRLRNAGATKGAAMFVAPASRRRRWCAGGRPRSRESRPHGASRGSPVDIVRGAPRSLEVDPAQCQTRHPEGAWVSAGPHRPRSRFSLRLGGDCGGGLPACPSGLLKPAGRFRESAGYWVLWDLGFLTPRRRPSGPP